MHHFTAIGEFKLELQSGNAQFRSKSLIVCLCEPEIWWLTLKNNRAPFLCCFKLCASCHCHQWIPRMDGRTDRSVLRAAWSQLKLAILFRPQSVNNVVVDAHIMAFWRFCLSSKGRDMPRDPFWNIEYCNLNHVTSSLSFFLAKRMLKLSSYLE